MRRFNILNSKRAFTFFVFHSLKESISVLSLPLRGQGFYFFIKNWYSNKINIDNTISNT